jgi:hypothetical protein
MAGYKHLLEIIARLLKCLVKRFDGDLTGAKKAGTI